MPASTNDSAVARSGIILAGGEGSRMGSYKPLVRVRGRPMIQWAFDALAPITDEVIVARGPALDPRLVLALGDRARFVEDPGQGPLPALLAAAQAARGTWLFVAPCDAPFLTPLVYDDLVRVAGTRTGACAMIDGVPHPLVAALRRERAIDAFRDALDRGMTSPRDAYRLLDIALAPMAMLDVGDVDTPEDAARAELG